MAYFNGRKILLAGLKGKPGETPYVGENGNWWVGETDTGVSAAGEASNARIDELEKKVDDLLYKAITINSFTNNIGTVEMGTIVTDVTLAWKFSKKAKSVTLDGKEQAADSTGIALTGLSISSNKTWTLKATDERDATATKTTAVSFMNGVYYGVAAEPAVLDSAFILGLTRTLRSNKLTPFTVNAGQGQYIYYCLPTRFGACTFTVGGFDGGFDLISTIKFKNASGYSEDYYVYRSANAGLGSTAVGVK